MPLPMVPVGAEVTVQKILAEERSKRHLENLGIGPGSRVRVLSAQGAGMILWVKGTRLALDKALACKIFIRLPSAER